ncbi:hypothetical protein [Flavobacterium aestivum]|uniref:hypothetical protein n=1 Tax=Flavobacterium aestivum TaxID=3003257 RepID=UPI0022865D95|nr:hypothetical protein [Flavobacterium aestivum]
MTKNKQTLVHFFARFLILSIPLVGLYFFAQMSFKANREREHPVDAGLGIAFLLFFILCAMFIGLTIDSAYRIRKKQFNIALTNLPFFLLFTLPILYLYCQIGYCEDCFCGWFLESLQ